MGVVRSFFSPEKARAMLSGKREGMGNVLSESLGILTPFCSCSAVPLFIGFVSAGCRSVSPSRS
ncbi:MAG: permease [Phaeovulum sp.]|nr:permease [Phaeovulum sp.]MDP3861040.1 permease [Phaeovulum sp.]